jgi:glycosyltransferase involved in cell wall biosynthesis
VVSGDLWAGAEVSAFNLMQELCARDGVRVQAIVLNEGPLHDRLVEAGVPTRLLPESRLSFARLMREGLGEARKLRPDVVHSHRYKEHLLGSAMSLASGAIHVRTAHGLPPELEWRGKLLGAGSLVDDAVSGWTGSTWIAVSSDLARRLDGVRRRVHVVPNGLPAWAPPAKRDVLQDAFGDGEPSWLVGFVGRLEGVKRPDRFLRILSALPERMGGRRVRGIVVGEGALRGELETQIRDLGLGPRLRLLGARADGERLVGGLDVLVVPSDHEGHPMVVLEAMRAGVPLVASAVGGIPEILGRAPWVVPPEDEPAMAEAVRGLLSDPERARAWAGTLRAAFASRYTIAATADRVLEVYAHA